MTTPLAALPVPPVNGPYRTRPTALAPMLGINGPPRPQLRNAVLRKAVLLGMSPTRPHRVIIPWSYCTSLRQERS